MSDRDKKLILIVLILAIALLPYFFYIKDKRVETEAILNNNVELDKRYQELKAMDANREFYLSETERYNKEMMDVIELYPADIKDENFTMFLLDTEYSSVEYNEDEAGNEVAEWVYPFRFTEYAYGDNLETPIEATDVSVEGTTVETVDAVSTGYVALSNTSVLGYTCRYEALKYMLEYLKEYKDPMIYKYMTMNFDKKTGCITGEIELAQYAISGPDRELPAVSFKNKFDGVEWDFSLDYMGIRGNEEVGVFGPYYLPGTGPAEDAEEGENADAEAEETETEEAAEEE